MPVGEQSVEDLKRQQQSLKTKAANLRREAIDTSLSPNLLRSTMLARDKGVGINRLCSATFEQLLAFSATFCTASNGQQLEQLLPSLAAFESTNS